VIAIVADVHIGNHRWRGGETIAGINERCTHAIGTLRNAIKATAKAAAERNEREIVFVVAGDLLDYARIEPQILANLASVFSVLAPHWSIMLLLGNHEQVSTAHRDHALGVFNALPRCRVIEAPEVIKEIAFVPFQPGNAREWFPKAIVDLVQKLGHSPIVTIGHVGIVMPDTPAFLREAHDAIPISMAKSIARESAFGLYVGNWHEPKLCSEDPFVAQVGSLCPTGFDNPGHGYGTVRCIFSDSSRKTLRVPGPRFLTIPWAEIDKAQTFVEDSISRGDFPNVRIDTESDADTTAAIARAANAENEELDLHVDVRPSRAEARAALRAAVAGTSALLGRGGTAEAALVRYVGSLKMPEGIEPAAVVAEAKRFMASGK
jgi:hypothetical protein